MSTASDLLFGRKPKVQTGTQPTMTASQLSLINALSNQVKGQIGKGITPYTEQPSLQQDAFDVVEDILAGRGKYGKRYEEGIAALEEYSEPYNETSAKEYWRKSVYDPAMQEYEGEISRMIEPYIAAGASDSGAARRAMAESGRKLTTDLTGQLAGIMHGEKQAHEQRKYAAEGELRQALTVPYEMALGSGGIQRQQDYQRWMMAQPWANPWLTQGTAALGGQPYDPYVIMRPGSKGMVQEFLGGGGGQALGGMMASDKSLKKDIMYL